MRLRLGCLLAAALVLSLAIPSSSGGASPASSTAQRLILRGGGSGNKSPKGGKSTGGRKGGEKPSGGDISAMQSLDEASSGRWEEKKDTVLSWESTDRMTDEEIGISEYVKPKRKGTGGIIKMGWSDFRVQEIRKRDGAPVVLNSTADPGERPADKRFLRFVLAKAGYDTVSAVGRIAHHMGVAAHHFRHAGIKDKSAVTCQEVTWGVEGLRNGVHFARMSNVSAWLPRIKVGNFEYCREHMRAGQHDGNRFTVLVRRLSLLDEAAVERAAGYLPIKGFVNYYGHQRFGLGMRSGMPTVRVGKAMLLGRWDDAVEGVMAWEGGVSDPEERAVKKKFSLEWEKVRKMGLGRTNSTKRIALEAIDGLPGHCFGEKAMLQGLARGQNPQQALREMPHRLLYMLAFWSWVWNKAASERIAKHGSRGVVVGDLVSPGNGGGGDVEADVRFVTEKDVEEGKFTIFDLVLPLPGKGATLTYPKNSAGEEMRRLLEEEGMLGTVVDPTAQGGKRAPSLYRHVVVQPREYSFEVLRYSKESDLVVEHRGEGGRFVSLWDGKEPGGGGAKKRGRAAGGHMALQLQFVLPPAAFATSLLREVTKESVHPNHHVTMRKEALK